MCEFETSMIDARYAGQRDAYNEKPRNIPNWILNYPFVQADMLTDEYDAGYDSALNEISWDN